MPVAINLQKCRCTTRDGSGRPGDRIGGRNARSARHCRRAAAGTSLVFLLQSAVAIVQHPSEIKVLRRPVESALFAAVAVLLAVLGILHHSSSKKPSSTVRVSGIFTLQAEIETTENFACMGTAPYADVHDGLPVTVRSQNGRVLARVSLQDSNTGLDEGCDLQWSATVPREPAYFVTFGTRGTVTLTRRDLTLPYLFHVYLGPNGKQVELTDGSQAVPFPSGTPTG